MAHILVVDDERSMRDVIRMLLTREGHEVETAADGQEGWEILKQGSYDLVISDIKMPRMNGIELLKLSKRYFPQTEVIVITAFSSTGDAISAMRAGAWDYITKPFKIDEIKATIGRALAKQTIQSENVRLKTELKREFGFESIVGKGPAMQTVFDLVRRVADTRTNILITGESGTGKELVARAVHYTGARGEKPFLVVNCGAIPANLLESELFGHRKGAFTGAQRDHTGLIESASGGSLFLDEIGELSHELQVKLLRVIQERKVLPIGDAREREVDTRFIAATNRDLKALVGQGRFREDLFYRLNVIEIRLPALRERREDIPPLVDHFISKYARLQNKAVAAIEREAMRLLLGWDFKGNVRELENVIERAVTLGQGGTIVADDLPDAMRTAAPPPPSTSPTTEGSGEALDRLRREVQQTGLERYLDGIERRLLVDALDRSGGVKTEAARLLGLTFRSFRYRLKKHGLTEPGETGENDADADA